MTTIDHGIWERERLLEALDAYQRGYCDAPVLHKRTESQLARANGDQSTAMDFVISTDEVDRHGDVISAEGWRLECYQSNPVFLWAHDYTRPVIGRAVEVWKEPHRLLARMEFAPTEFAQEVAMLYQAGYQRGVSVGFKPIRYEERRHEKTGAFLGIRFLEQELLEASAVPVPANRSALRKALASAPRVGEYLRRVDEREHPGETVPEFAPAAIEGIWPELAARVDELEKMAEELSQIIENAEPPRQRELSRGQIGQVLAALRSAGA